MRTHVSRSPRRSEEKAVVVATMKRVSEVFGAVRTIAIWLLEAELSASMTQTDCLEVR